MDQLLTRIEFIKRFNAEPRLKGVCVRWECDSDKYVARIFIAGKWVGYVYFYEVCAFCNMYVTGRDITTFSIASYEELIIEIQWQIETKKEREENHKKYFPNLMVGETWKRHRRNIESVWRQMGIGNNDHAQLREILRHEEKAMEKKCARRLAAADYQILFAKR